MRTVEGPALMREAARSTDYSSAWTCYRTTEGTPSADASTASVGSRTAYIWRVAGSRMQQAAAGVGIWASDYLIVAAPDADIQSTDLLSDGSGHVFLVTVTPETDRGVLLAPVKVSSLPI